MKSAKSMGSLTNKGVLLLGMVTFLIIVAPIVYLIVQSINKPLEQLKLDIKNKTSNSHEMSFRVDECENCRKLVIRGKDGNIIFEESLEDNEDNRFRKYLIDKVVEGDKKIPLSRFLKINSPID